MAKEPKSYENDVESNELDWDDEDEDFDPEDYVFVIAPSGDIKTVIFPNSDEIGYTKKMLAIFKAFGVDNPDSLLEKRTLH